MIKPKFLFVLFLCLLIGFPSWAWGITAKEEQDMGKEFMRVVKSRFKLIEDPVALGCLNRVCDKILSVADKQPFTYHFYIIQEPTWNAFAGPGGHVFINSGLFMDLDSEAELAGIMAHELAHVNCRHISQKVERSKSLGLATLAGIAAGLLLGVGGAVTAANAVTVGTVAAGQSAMLAYSREDEMQADQVALRYLTDTGFGGMGLLTSLKKIRSHQWFGSSDIPTYLSTHPASEDRLAYLDSWLHARPGESRPKPKEKESSPLSDDSFKFARVRLLALYADPGSARRKLAAMLEKAPADPVVQCGNALLLAREGNRKQAVVFFRKALEKAPFNPVVLTDLGKVYFFDGQLEQALAVFKSAWEISSNDSERAYFLGRALLESGQVKESLAFFLDLASNHPDFHRTLYYLGEAYGKSGDLANAHYYLGRYEENAKDWKTALFHYQKALDVTTDSSRKKDITLRMDKLKKKGRQEKAGDPENAPGISRPPMMPVISGQNGKIAW